MKPKRKKKITQIMWAVGWQHSGRGYNPSIKEEGAWLMFPSKQWAEKSILHAKQDVKKVRVTIEVL